MAAPAAAAARTAALRRDAADIFASAVAAVCPNELVARAVSREGDVLTLRRTGERFPLRRNVRVYGFGKAVPGMVAAVDALLRDHIVDGVASVPVGSVAALSAARPELLPKPGCPVSLREGAAGNLPDADAAAAAAEILAGAEAAREGELVVLLVSGGGSALLPHPSPGVSLADKRAATAALARRGATIDDLNCVRKHLSAVKGGRLAAAAHPATVLALILSDVIGDPLETIASGPTVPDPTTFADCVAVVDRLGAAADIPPLVLAHLRSGAAGEAPDTPKPGQPPFDGSAPWLHNELVGTNRIALDAAEARARELGYDIAHRHADPLDGNARDAARQLVGELSGLARDGSGGGGGGSGEGGSGKVCVLAGGETTCVVTGTGRGGRNQEIALLAGILLSDDGVPGAVLLSGGTDGQDGPTDAAGGFADAGLAADCAAAGLDPGAFLANNDSNTVLGRVGRLLRTGLTGTNVMDVVVGLVDRGDADDPKL